MSLAMSNFMNETEILKKKTSFEKIKLPRLHRILIKKNKTMICFKKKCKQEI